MWSSRDLGTICAAMLARGVEFVVIGGQAKNLCTEHYSSRAARFACSIIVGSCLLFGGCAAEHNSHAEEEKLFQTTVREVRASHDIEPLHSEPQKWYDKHAGEVIVTTGTVTFIKNRGAWLNLDGKVACFLARDQSIDRTRVSVKGKLMMEPPGYSKAPSIQGELFGCRILSVGP